MSDNISQLTQALRQDLDSRHEQNKQSAQDDIAAAELLARILNRLNVLELRIQELEAKK